ncbi:MAG: hypothetical protein DBY37_15855 [Desulfovibrionaceae bacterium]|nr:MAG: hypothetical protein DBY37_15855 [Desulfovibrionaceae bacterium]
MTFSWSILRLKIFAGQRLMFRLAGFAPPPELYAASELRRRRIGSVAAESRPARLPRALQQRNAPRGGDSVPSFPLSVLHMPRLRRNRVRRLKTLKIAEEMGAGEGEEIRFQA